MEAPRPHEDAVEMCDRGFQLAYFLVRNRSSAIQIVSSAMNKLAARCKQEKKRAFWRDKYLKRRETKISRADGDTLQWLIYCESEPHERLQEKGDGIASGAFVVRYIKSLIQMTTGMSSFYVAVGMHRFVYNYSTSDIQRVYELLTERYLGADEYRRAKRFLMDKLTIRFAGLLKTMTMAHGEQRFELAERQERFLSLVRESLQHFIPWSTSGRCPVPDKFRIGDVALPVLLFGSGHSQLNWDAVEMNRCHAFIDDLCFGRLAKALGFEAPENKLALPRSYSHNNDGSDDDFKTPPSPPNLMPHERRMIATQLATESARRQRVLPRMMRVLIDGTERSRLDLTAGSQSMFALPESARLVEIWTEDEDGVLLLATHVISYTESQKIAPSVVEIRLNQGVRLTLTISQSPNGAADGHSALVLLTCSQGSLPLWNPPFASLRSRAFQYAWAAVVLIGVGFALGTFMHRQALVRESARAARLNAELAQARLPSSQNPVEPFPNEIPGTVTTRLSSYDLNTRGTGTPELPVVTVPAHASLVNLELPTAATRGRTYNAVLTLFPERVEILRETVSVPAGTQIPIAVLWVPSSLLRDDQQYLVELMSTGPDRTTADTFMFHVTKSGK